MTALLRRGPRATRCAPDRLQHFKAFELRMTEIKRLVVAGAAMGGAKCFGLRPRRESSLIGPDGVRGVERVVLGLRPAQEVKLKEAWHALQMRVTRKPDLLESFFFAFDHLEAVHRNEHRSLTLPARTQIGLRRARTRQHHRAPLSANPAVFL